MNDALAWLQQWYLENCDGDWEHMSLTDGKLQVHCGALNLSEAIEVFRRWAEVE